MANHFFTDIPGAVHNNSSRDGVVVGRLQSIQAKRKAVGSDIGPARSIDSCGACLRAWLVGEALQPPGAQRVGTPAMRDQMRACDAVGEIHQVQSWDARGLREIRNCDEIAVGDAVAIFVQAIKRAAKQRRGDWRSDALCSPECGPGASRRKKRRGSDDGKMPTPYYMLQYPLALAYAPDDIIVVQCIREHSKFM